MDTKWKKCKLVISYASFVAALCLLLAVLLMGSGLLAAMKSIAISPADAFQGDYQDTKAFRQYISYRLEDFIMMAAGGSPGASVGTAYASDTGVSEEQQQKCGRKPPVSLPPHRGDGSFTMH